MKKESAGMLVKILGKGLGIVTLAGTLGLATATAQFYTEKDPLQARLEHARGLAAANNLPAAAKELEAVRASTQEDAIRDATGLMLMNLYFEQSNYGGAQNLLEDVFKMRGKNASSFFATAGQSLHGVRGRLERYRTYNLNINAADLPAEAVADLEKMRSLLERVAEQSSALNAENPKSFEAKALLEDVATLRASLSRDSKDRARWNGVLSSTRQRMVESDSRMKANEILRRDDNSANNTVARNNPPAPAPARNNTEPMTAGGSMMPVTVPGPEAETPRNAPPPVANKPVAATTSSKKGRTDDAPKNNNSEAAVRSAPPIVTPTASVTPVVPASSAPLTPGQSLEVGPLMARAAQKRNPTYPPMAKNARITGLVKVYLEVDEKGGIVKVRKVEGPSMLQRAAEDAARGWKFNETVIDGQPVRVTGFLVFNFIL